MLLVVVVCGRVYYIMAKRRNISAQDAVSNIMEWDDAQNNIVRIEPKFMNN